MKSKTKSLFIVFASILSFTSCTDWLTIDIKNNRDEVIQLTIISSEFKLIQDTSWSEEDSMLVIRQWIDADPIQLQPIYARNRKSVDNNELLDGRLFTDMDINQCFYFVENVNMEKPLKVSFKIMPHESFNLVSYHSSHISSLKPHMLWQVDTLIIESVDSTGTLKLNLNGFDEIKNLIADPENCKTCILSIN